MTATCQAGSSPLASCPGPQTVSTEGTNQIISLTAADTDGLTATASVTLNIDKTIPALAVSPPADGSAFSASPVTVSGSVSDALSGLASLTCNGVAVTPSNGSFSCNISLNIGVNLIMLRATDVAGNVAGSNFHVSLSSGGSLPAPTSLQVSPAMVNMLVGDTQQFTAVDQQGRPRSDATWSIDNTSLAALSGDPTTPSLVTGVAPGTATLTATVGSVSAQAQINILGGTSLPPGTARWTAPSTPGFAVQHIAQAVPTNNGPDLYSLEMDGNNTPLVRALTADGQQMWVTELLPKSDSQVFGIDDTPMPDGNGGILLRTIANPGVLPARYQLVDLDAQTGAQLWTFDLAFNFNTLPGTTAIGQDGTIFKLQGVQGQLAIVSINPATGSMISFYTPALQSTFAFNVTSGSFCSSASGTTPAALAAPLSVAPDGTVYSVVSKFDLVATNFCELGPFTFTFTNYLLQLAPGGSPSLTQIRQDVSQQTFNGGSFAGFVAIAPNITIPLYQPIPTTGFFRIIPDGQGGVLIPYELAVTAEFAPSPFKGHITHLAAAGGVSDFMPFQRPDSTPPLSLVLGENSTAFVTDSQSLLSFNTNSGSSNWAYSAPTGHTINILAALDATSGAAVAISDPQSGTTSFDSSGNPSQVSAGNALGSASYSWRGAWDAFGSSSAVSGIALPLVESTSSLWANLGGSPSSNNAAGRPWYFILNWQNAFDFIPDKPSILPNLKVDITSQATTIKTAALEALKQAYKRWPVVAVEGTPGTGDHQAVVQTTSTDQGPSCGSTNINVINPVDSEVWYECNMEQAQWALQIAINNAQDETNALARKDLIQAIGRGIGSNAAHEIAHQFLLGCCSMDALISDDPNAAGTYNDGSADGDANPLVVNSDPSPYTGYWKDGTTPIHWENTTQVALDKCLMKGWIDFGRACSAKLSLSQNSFPSQLRVEVLAKALAPHQAKKVHRVHDISVLPFLADIVPGKW